jgi:hypothetical protein
MAIEVRSRTIDSSLPCPQMNSNPSGRHEPLSLQDKLDRISHERDLLAVRRDLARHGLHEGDMVRNVDNGASGRLVIVARSGATPYCTVRLDNGSDLPFDVAHWNRVLR